MMTRCEAHGDGDRGLDYTPLFRFLLANVGRDFREVLSEASARLDREDPIYWLVARSKRDKQPIVRMSESSYYSGLYIDEGNVLRVVAPEVTVETLTPFCACCTHTLNGVRFVKTFARSESEEAASGRPPRGGASRLRVK